MTKRIIVAVALLGLIGGEALALPLHKNASRAARFGRSASRPSTTSTPAATPVAEPAVLVAPKPVVVEAQAPVVTPKPVQRKPVVAKKKQESFFKRHLGKIIAGTVALAGLAAVDHYGVPSFVPKSEDINKYVKNETLKRAFTYIKGLFTKTPQA